MVQINRKLKVAVLSRNFSAHMGGAENYAVSLTEKIAQHHEVQVFCQTSDVRNAAIRIHKMPFSLKKPRWVNMLMFSAWTGLKTRHGFDIVHSHENVFHGNVHTFHVKPMSFNLFQSPHPAKWMTWLKIATSPRLISYLWVEHRRVIATSPRLLMTASALLKQIYIDTFKIPQNSVQVLTPGVNLPAPKLADAVHDQSHDRALLGLPKNQYLLLMVGHNYEKKGLATLLNALTLLPENVSAVVVGDPSHITKWKKRCQGLNIAGRVFFLGKQTEMAAVYRASDCLVHATLEDVFPIVILEAMAHCLPVVVSPAPYCLSSDLLSPNTNAIVLKDPQDAAALSAHIVFLMTNRQKSQAMAEAGFEFSKSYDWGHLAQNQMDMYIQFLDETHASS